MANDFQDPNFFFFSHRAVETWLCLTPLTKIALSLSLRQCNQLQESNLVSVENTLRLSKVDWVGWVLC